MVETIDRKNIKSLLINDGQNKVGPCLNAFATKINQINSIEDLANLCNEFKTNMYPDKEKITSKFSRTSEEIFKDKICSGCSDFGTAIAPILRMKGIPTIYVQSARTDWIYDLIHNTENAKQVRGHIFLEIYLNNNWLLFDPTNGYLYTNYNYNNACLPHNYYAFSKSLNGHEVGCDSVQHNNDIMKNYFLNNNLQEYVNPEYQEIDLNKIFITNIKKHR